VWLSISLVHVALAGGLRLRSPMPQRHE